MAPPPPVSSETILVVPTTTPATSTTIATTPSTTASLTCQRECRKFDAAARTESPAATGISSFELVRIVGDRPHPVNAHGRCAGDERRCEGREEAGRVPRAGQERARPCLYRAAADAAHLRSRRRQARDLQRPPPRHPRRRRRLLALRARLSRGARLLPRVGPPPLPARRRRGALGERSRRTDRRLRGHACARGRVPRCG